MGGGDEAGRQGAEEPTLAPGPAPLGQVQPFGREQLLGLEVRGGAVLGEGEGSACAGGDVSRGTGYRLVAQVTGNSAGLWLAAAKSLKTSASRKTG